MFTGIIQKVVCLQSVEKKQEEARIIVNTEIPNLVLGESIALNGVCLTVAKIINTAGIAEFHLSNETMNCTNFGTLKAHANLNMERALCVGDSLSGHWVQGHVDCIAKISALEKDSKGESYRLQIFLEKNQLRYCVVKGSIAVNGVSLTINSIKEISNSPEAEISIQLIPHTWEHTNFSSLKVGDSINIEFDVLAKYMENLYARTK